MNRVALAFLVAAAAGLTSCQSGAPGPGQLDVSASDAAYPAMNRVLTQASACWFKSGNSDFASYKIASELDSYSGRPRLLIVPRNSPESRPLAVIQAEGSPAKVQAFGPLMSAPVGNRIAADVKRWAGGGSGCGTSA